MEGDTNIVSEPSKKAEPSGTKVLIDELYAKIEQLQQESKSKDAVIQQIHEQPINQPTNVSLTNSINELTVQVTQLRQQLKEKDDMIAQLHKHVLYVETELPLQSKKRKCSNTPLTNADENETEQMDSLRAENERLKEQLEELRNNDPASEPTTENISTQNQTTVGAGTPSNAHEIIQIIEKKLKEGFSEIKDNVNQFIETKLNKLPPTVTENTPPNSVTPSYASAVGRSHVSGDLKAIMMTTKNEEIAEQNEKKRRAKNIMVFGKSEYSQRWQEGEDKKFAEQLFKDIQVGPIKIKEVIRIGEYNREGVKVRPLKITVDSEEEQQKIMRNLSNLKGNEEYGGISIKEDYTINERQLIREYTQQAKALNALEAAKKSTTVYKVRGTPKNGLFLKKFMTRRETTEVSDH